MIILRIATQNVQNFNPNLTPAQVAHDLAAGARVGAHLHGFQELTEARDWDAAKVAFPPPRYELTAKTPKLGPQQEVTSLHDTLVLTKTGEETQFGGDSAPGYHPRRFTKVTTFAGTRKHPPVAFLNAHLQNGVPKGHVGTLASRLQHLHNLRREIRARRRAGYLVVVTGDFNWTVRLIQLGWGQLRLGRGIDGIFVLPPRGWKAQQVGPLGVVAVLSAKQRQTYRDSGFAPSNRLHSDHALLWADVKVSRR